MGQRYAVYTPSGWYRDASDGYVEYNYEVVGTMRTSRFYRLWNLRRPQDFQLLVEATQVGNGMQRLTSNPSTDSYNPHFRHTGLQNISFGDGHVESVTVARFAESYRLGNYADAAQWQINSTGIYTLPYGWEVGQTSERIWISEY